jgi:hypothetical protein
MRRENGPDFIGLGAQRAGTSWIYACLYEHPEICAPVKEIHFFSRERNWARGYPWYEAIFERCPPDAKRGEFSTSYLVDPGTPARVYRRYPTVKLVASLRNPIQRAYSNYRNDMVAGVVSPDTEFSEALKRHPEYVEQGRYHEQLGRYLERFAKDQLLVLIHEDALRDPRRFIQTLYAFLGVDASFHPSMLRAKVNPGRVPRHVWIERLAQQLSDLLRSRGLEGLWWRLKKGGVGRWIRALNSRRQPAQDDGPAMAEREFIYRSLETDIQSLERLLGRELRAWRL